MATNPQISWLNIESLMENKNETNEKKKRRIDEQQTKYLHKLELQMIAAAAATTTAAAAALKISEKKCK